MLSRFLVERLFKSWLFRRRLREEISGTLASSPPFRVPPPNLVANPYRADAGDGPHRDLPYTIFITSRFRSGSTLLWNMFNRLGQFTCYYEPLNERRWFRADIAGERVDPTHVGVSDYRLHYEGLEALDDFFSPGWGYHRLCMGEDALDWEMQAYIDTLLRRAAAVPVLQFNRVDFRLGWLRANYPAARILHLIRDPREQWVSTLHGQSVPNTATLAEFPAYDGFYMMAWLRDLRTVFPCLNLPETTPAYRAHYLLWRLSQIFGEHYGDVTLKYEDLAARPAECLKRCLAQLKGPDVSEESWTAVAEIVRTRPQTRWREYAPPEWFEEHEAACEWSLSKMFDG